MPRGVVRRVSVLGKAGCSEMDQENKRKDKLRRLGGADYSCGNVKRTGTILVSTQGMHAPMLARSLCRAVGHMGYSRLDPEPEIETGII